VPQTDDRHALAEARSLELHRLVAERLREEPPLVEKARARVRGWLDDGSVHRIYAEAWREALDGPLEQLLALLVDPGQRARDLRQASPFAGFLDPRVRWDALRRVRRPLPPP
jgi:hypothetical protein